MSPVRNAAVPRPILSSAALRPLSVCACGPRSPARMTARATSGPILSRLAHAFPCRQWRARAGQPFAEILVPQLLRIADTVTKHQGANPGEPCWNSRQQKSRAECLVHNREKYPQTGKKNTESGDGPAQNDPDYSPNNGPPANPHQL